MQNESERRNDSSERRSDIEWRNSATLTTPPAACQRRINWSCIAMGWSIGKRSAGHKVLSSWQRTFYIVPSPSWSRKTLARLWALIVRYLYCDFQDPWAPSQSAYLRLRKLCVKQLMGLIFNTGRSLFQRSVSFYIQRPSRTQQWRGGIRVKALY